MTGDQNDWASAWPEFALEPKPGLWARICSSRLAWPLVLVAGFLLFEFTADPALGILMGCLKFGWDELRFSRRLRREDPESVRGRVCARFYEAFALWRVSLVALGVMFLAILVHGALHDRARPPGQPAPEEPPREFITASLILVVGFGAAALSSMLAVIAALRHRVKVWVGYRHNRIKPILLSVILFWGVPLLLVAFFTPLMIAAAPAPGKPAVGLLIGVMFVVFYVIFPVGLLLFVGWVESRIAAHSPVECWPELLLPPDQQPKFLSQLRF
jgi:hypothetical protein